MSISDFGSSPERLTRRALERRNNLRSRQVRIRQVIISFSAWR